MRRASIAACAWAVQLGAALSLGCTSVVVPRVEHPSREEEPEPESVAPIAIDRVVLARGGETVIRLERDGSLVAGGCRMRLDERGIVTRGEDAVLTLEPTGRVVDRDGREVFTLEERRLVRAANGGAAVLEGAAGLEGDRVAFERSPDLALEVERAAGGDDRAVLMTVAALSMCEERGREDR